MKSTLCFCLMISAALSASTDQPVVIDGEKLGLHTFDNSREQHRYVVSVYTKEVMKRRLRDNSFGKNLPVSERALTGIKMELAVRHFLTLLEKEYEKGVLTERERVAKVLEAKRLLGDASRETNLFDKALEVYEELIVLTAGSTFEIEALAFKATVHHKLGDLETELALLSEAASHPNFMNVKDSWDVGNHLDFQRKLANRLAEAGRDDMAAEAFALFFEKAAQYRYYSDYLKRDLAVFRKVNHSVRAPLPDLEALRDSTSARGGFPEEVVREIADQEEQAAHYERQLDIVVENWRAMH